MRDPFKHLTTRMPTVNAQHEPFTWMPTFYRSDSPIVTGDFEMPPDLPPTDTQPSADIPDPA